MAKLPIVSGTEAVKALKRLGFFVDRQRGSHVVLKKITPEGERGCVIPMHREVALGTLRSALKWRASRRKNSATPCNFAPGRKQPQAKSFWDGRTPQEMFGFHTNKWRVLNAMKNKWVSIVFALLVVSITPVQAGIFDNLKKGLNNAINNSSSGNNDSDAETSQRPQPVVEDRSYYTVSEGGDKIPFPMEQVFTTRTYEINFRTGVWYLERASDDYWTLTVCSEPTRILNQNHGTLFAFDPSVITQTNGLDGMVLQFKSAQEAWWKMNTQNHNPNQDAIDALTGYLQEKQKLDAVKSDASNKVKIYKSIESGDDISVVRKKLADDSTVTLLNTNRADAVEFASTYLGDPCNGVISFSSNGRVAIVILAASEKVTQAEYINNKTKEELQKSDVDRAKEELQQSAQSTQDKINASQGDIDAAGRAFDIEKIAKNWSAAIQEKYPAGFSDDGRVQYDATTRPAVIVITDIFENGNDLLSQDQKQLNRTCDAIEADFKKVNASKNDL